IREVPIRNVDELYFKKEQLSIFEMCVRMFTDEVLNVVRNGLKQTYVPYQGNEMFVKGKTLYSEHARKNFAHKERFFVEYDIFSVNRAENRLIKKTLETLEKLSSNNLNKKKIRMLLMSLDGVDASFKPNDDFKNSVEDRGMNKYFNAMKWCRLFLLSKGTTFTTGGRVKYAMLFHMDKLFSACIASSLRKQIDRTNYYFMTPEKISNSISNTGMDKEMRPISDFYIKNRFTGNTINVRFKFKNFSDYNGSELENTVLVFPVTEVLNTTFSGIGKTMYLIDLNDIDSSVSVLTETFFV
ncbi:MAG: McrC family protein, partial [Oscillospiraceae bacterium]|nr:McrC family protein [Oscillospiraceae bacterium]